MSISKEEWAPIISGIATALSTLDHFSISPPEKSLRQCSYCFRLTIYKLFAPLAIYRLIQLKLTLVNFKLDYQISLQYQVIR